MSSVSPTNQDLSNDTTFSQIKSRVPVPLRMKNVSGIQYFRASTLKHINGIQNHKALMLKSITITGRDISLTH